MAKMTKIPLKVQKLTEIWPETEKMTPKLKKWPKLKNDEKWPKKNYKSYISVTSSSSPGFIYLRASHRLQAKKDDMSSKFGPWSWVLRVIALFHIYVTVTIQLT
jgi:hypothetical protein